jgi:riboflavin synthase
VAVDGISLTINRCAEEFFDIGIIPHTSLMTTIRTKKIGAKVNIETDLIGKYVERFVLGRETAKSDGNQVIQYDFVFSKKHL